MTSTPATAASPSSPAAELGTLSSKMPPSEVPLPENAVDTPSSSQFLESHAPHISITLNNVNDVRELDASGSQQRANSDNESDDDLEEGEIAEDAKGDKEEHTETMVLDDHMIEEHLNVSKDTTHEDFRVTQTPSEDGLSTDVRKIDDVGATKTAKAYKPDGEERVYTTREATDSDVDVSEEGKREDSDGVQDDLVKKEGDAAVGIGGEESFGDDEDTATETQEANDALAQPRSVPPHMRPSFKGPVTQNLGAQQLGRDWPTPVPRAPRVFCPPSGYQPSRPPVDLDELQRMRAQLMKARNDLEVERKVNAEMRRTVGAEKQASISAAMSDMLTELLQKQADALAAKAKIQEKDRELQHREQKIAQLEAYLADGQKQLKFQLEEQGIRMMSAVEEAHLCRDVELKLRHQFFDIEGKIGIQVERLRHQEAAQKIREQEYKASIRDALETEIREQLVQGVRAKAVVSKATEVVYERGLPDGKQVVGVKAPEETLKREFLKGYAACYRSLTALYNLRNGHVTADSPELAFLFDPTHSENPHNMGLSIGRVQDMAEKAEKGMDGVITSSKPVEGVAARAAVIVKEPQAIPDAVTLHGQNQAQFSEAGSSRPVHIAHRSEQARSTPVQRSQQEGPSCR
ncbi:hypothetical protein SLS59_001991 [Nothophoma quercina]|uniref:Uncharacterized protein n=1 Tax=Nothophoma quercina TaxID=749835 RepID=A0ABR3RWI8_9PLEO